MTNQPYHFKGLSDTEVAESLRLHGANRLAFKNKNTLIASLQNFLKEPMILLLLVASTIYFISGHVGDGIFLTVAVVIISSISLYQNNRSKNALEKLKEYTQQQAKVIRNSEVQTIQSEALVLGDYLIIEEGDAIAADGIVVQAHDCTVNESILTGESLAIEKNVGTDQAPTTVFHGTTVVSGAAVVCISAIGNSTKLGSIGKSLESIIEEKTPLEIQINQFVKILVYAGAVIFFMVWGIHFYYSHNWLDSLLKALTIAMSVLPEEIPMAFTSFMAIGAWRLMKMGIIVKQMKTVETLGSATVICTDKTGTLTENNMSIAKVYDLAVNHITDATATLSEQEKLLITYAMWASEPAPFDPMEVAIHAAYALNTTTDDRPLYHLAHEYALEGKPPMMTHVFKNNNNETIVAAKGAVEAIAAVSHVTKDQQQQIDDTLQTLMADGYRVLAIAKGNLQHEQYPTKQQEIPFVFIGLMAFYDPPKKNIAITLQQFYDAGIDVKIITGDHTATTKAIAQQIGFRNAEHSIEGNALMALDEPTLATTVQQTALFTRMFPEAKLKIIHALKAQHAIVAMTGDGVNDGPALKAAHIGIAMGKKGTAIAKQAASLILVDDDLSKMVDAIAMGRKIYTNLKKAFRYIISIHIPIILTVFIPLVFGWIFPNIFSPVHIIFLELVMGPTCSIMFENEPLEKNTMQQPPREYTNSFFSWKEISMSIVQGLMITVGTLFVYQYSVQVGNNEAVTRTMVFSVLIASNILLTLVNRSFYYSIFTTIRYKNNLVLLMIGATIIITACMLFVEPITHFFSFQTLQIQQLIICIGISFVAVGWVEIYKWIKRNASKKS